MDNIKQTDASEALRFYSELVRFALDSGSAPGLRARREDLENARLTADQLKKLASLDGEAIADVLEVPYIDADLIQDDSAQPLVKWWWHLGKIRNKTYPAELLPDHLKAIYAEPPGDKKAA